MTYNFEQLQQAAKAEIDHIADAKSLEDLRIKYLGRKGIVQEIYATLSGLPKEEKPLVGKAANDLRNRISQWLQEKNAEIQALEQRNRVQRESIDLSLPGVAHPIGHKHLLTQTIDEICGIFERLGFSVYEGPEIETEFHNFTALNIPIDHPSRDAFDTFYLQVEDPERKGRHFLLRSHTSPGQIRIMKKNQPPLAVIIPGKVYRPDAVDASHSFMFHQIEGLLVDKDVKFSDLKGLLLAFCRRYFGEDVRMRFRPHFFPFTEPSAEVDISWERKGGGKKKSWLEIMGCGLVHPKVFEAAGYPQGKYTGLAFGLGVERMTMLKHGIQDIRVFYENDVRFLRQF